MFYLQQILQAIINFIFEQTYGEQSYNVSLDNARRRVHDNLSPFPSFPASGRSDDISVDVRGDKIKIKRFVYYVRGQGSPIFFGSMHANGRTTQLVYKFRRPLYTSLFLTFYFSVFIAFILIFSFFIVSNFIPNVAISAIVTLIIASIFLRVMYLIHMRSGKKPFENYKDFVLMQIGRVICDEKT